MHLYLAPNVSQFSLAARMQVVFRSSRCGTESPLADFSFCKVKHDEGFGVLINNGSLMWFCWHFISVRARTLLLS